MASFLFLISANSMVFPDRHREPGEIQRGLSVAVAYPVRSRATSLGSKTGNNIK